MLSAPLPQHTPLARSKPDWLIGQGTCFSTVATGTGHAGCHQTFTSSVFTQEVGAAIQLFTCAQVPWRAGSPREPRPFAASVSGQGAILRTLQFPGAFG